MMCEMNYKSRNSYPVCLHVVYQSANTRSAPKIYYSNINLRYLHASINVGVCCGSKWLRGVRSSLQFINMIVLLLIFIQFPC